MTNQDAITCQKCKHHKNHPSYCKIKDQFVGRKQVICEDEFKPKKVK